MNDVLQQFADGYGKVASNFKVQTDRPDEWLVPLAAFAILVGAILLLGLIGMGGPRSLVSPGFWRSQFWPPSPRNAVRPMLWVSRGARMVFGLPGWAAAQTWLAIWALATGVVGFIWDVSWHADLGRDALLFTVPHTMMVTVMIFTMLAGVVGIAYASLMDVRVGWIIGRLRVPYSSAALILLGGAATFSFPLDDWWHATYGLDVSMWSPPHVMMLSAESFIPIVLALGVAEARPNRDHPMVKLLIGILAAAILAGLNTFMLEFDIGVPQWQELFHPLLIAGAAAAGLVAGRVLLGRGGAIQVALGFLAIRFALNFMTAGLDRTQAHFPLYLGEAVAVELAFWLGRRYSPVWRALIAGALIGTVGMATEWVWMSFWGREVWQLRMLPSMWVPLVMALAAAVLGLGLGNAIRGRPIGLRPWMPVAALLVVGGMLAIPLDRQNSGATVHFTTAQAADLGPTVDRNGLRGEGKSYLVAIDITPQDAPIGADWFEVIAWQGGSIVRAPFHQTAPGQYHTTVPVPTGGNWKSGVYLENGPVLSGTFISAPPDPQYGLPLIPVPEEQTARLHPMTDILLREAHSGIPLPAIVIKIVAIGSVLMTAAILIFASSRVASGRTTEIRISGRRPRRKAFAGA